MSSARVGIRKTTSVLHKIDFVIHSKTAIPNSNYPVSKVLHTRASGAYENGNFGSRHSNCLCQMRAKPVHRDCNKLCSSVVLIEFRVNLGEFDDSGMCKACGVFDESYEFSSA